MFFRRGSSVRSEAQRQAVVRGLLKPGESFDMMTGEYLSPRYVHGKRRIRTISERIEELMTRYGLIRHMDGGNYQDTRLPFTAADVASVTLATTDKALYPIANFPVLGSNYFGFIGKKIAIKLFGRMTTAVTPGNGAFDIYWGTGADANGTILQSSTAVALAASQTNLSWCVDLLVTCRGFGAAGALLVTGTARLNASLYATFNAAALASEMIPASAPAQVTADLTAANIVSVQYKRSGSTAETMLVHDGLVTSLN
jgi:hypothetical protein